MWVEFACRWVGGWVRVVCENLRVGAVFVHVLMGGWAGGRMGAWVDGCVGGRVVCVCLHVGGVFAHVLLGGFGYVWRVGGRSFIMVVCACARVCLVAPACVLVAPACVLVAPACV